MEDFKNKSYENRIEDIKHNLYQGGGEGQAHSLLTIMMDSLGKWPDIDPCLVLTDISNLLRQYQRIIKTSGIVPIDYFMSGKQHEPYACLDNNLKFCVKHFGEDDWKDIKYVFPYMHTNTAFDVSFGYDRIFTPDI